MKKKNSYFYFKLSDMVNSFLNLGEPIPDSKFLRTILNPFNKDLDLKLLP